MYEPLPQTEEEAVLWKEFTGSVGDVEEGRPRRRRSSRGKRTRLIATGAKLDDPLSRTWTKKSWRRHGKTRESFNGVVRQTG